MTLLNNLDIIYRNILKHDIKNLDSFILTNTILV